MSSSFFKPAERAAKLLLALLTRLLFFRPWRAKARAARVSSPRKILLVRIDRRVGEALLTTPLLATLRQLSPAPEVHLLLHAKVAQVLHGHPMANAVLSFDRRRLCLGPLSPGILPLRKANYDAVVDCTNWTAPSLTSAIVSRLAGPRSAVIGPSEGPSASLHTHRVPPRTDTENEVLQRLHFLSPLGAFSNVTALSFPESWPGPAVRTFLGTLGGRPYAVINPGGRLAGRRIPESAFAAGARALLQTGLIPVVTWGPGEEELAHQVCQGAPGAVPAPPTDIHALASLMKLATLTVCNNTGPMHLSVAVGTPTLAFFIHLNPLRWGHGDPPHKFVDVTSLLNESDKLEGEVEARTREFALAVRRH